ncbi:MAG TPA: phosphoenolpyruvate--protein phosphotransferase, partial [Planctomycetota bacterium]|nr:phosphoenolpyruvate--protein phosphotransferase [Planctomycetota bacterium]
MATINGIAVAPGLVRGPVHVVRARADKAPHWTLRHEEIDADLARLRRAIEVVQERLERQKALVERTSGAQDAGIFAVHQMILRDPSALGAVERAIREERVNAESAVQDLVRKLRSTMGQLDGDSVRDYAADLSEPWRVVLDELLERDREQVLATDDSVILAADELSPQVVTFSDPSRILGIVTTTGGRFSHGAVLARAFGIPCVVGLPNLLGRLEQGMNLLVDGDQGRILINPTEEEAKSFDAAKKSRDLRRKALIRVADKPAVTLDGGHLRVMVNLESLRDLGTFNPAHCDGVGLLRTEFLYMERSQFPSEEEQFRLYRRVVDHMEGKVVVFRTLDLGGDKQLPYFTLPEEENPALGWRGLRITLEWQDLMRVQLRAILRAGCLGPVRILLPMVTSIGEVRRVREILNRVREQLIAQGYEVPERVELGVMLEVPSSVLILRDLVKIVDFVSVGTNDLVQYLLATDRDNPFVAKMYEPYHPAVIRSLAYIGRVCRESGCEATVCGDLAGDFVVAMMLLGMGFYGVSVSPHFLAEVRLGVRTTTRERLDRLVHDLAQAGDDREVQ